MQRRDALKVIAAAALGACGPGREAKSAAAAAPDRLERVGLQLYTVRGEMARDVEDTLARVAAIGYLDVEFAGYFERSPAAIRQLLDRNGLRAPAAHIGDPSALGAGWEAALEAAQVIGHEYVAIAYIAAGDRRTLDDYRRHADRFNEAAALARAAGVRFAYHNHDFEFAPLEGQLPYDVLLERTDPALVEMELDLFWITKAGHDPGAYFARHPGRFPMVHVKDMTELPAGQMVDVGRGVIDFARIFAQREQAGIRHFFVEHDEPEPSGLASAAVSYRHLAALRF